MASSPPRNDLPLRLYRQKRDFTRTPEPDGESGGQSTSAARTQKALTETGNEPRQRPLGFVIQKHWARSLHYDFRLELDGVLLSWAVPKGPSFDPAQKRMAVHVEDHPLTYGDFEGEIPRGQYGAGSVIVWDRGTWEPIGEPRAGLDAGKLVFRLHGEKLAGLWELVRTAKPDARQEQWLLFKKRDEWARPKAQYDVVTDLPDSVIARPLGPIEDSHAPAPDLSAAVEAPLPDRLRPQLATLVDSAAGGDRWTVEPKLDGYRILARVSPRAVKLITRGGHDWTSKLLPLAGALEEFELGDAWLDGEIVVMDDHGRPDFSALQNAMDEAHGQAIVYFVFDAPYLDGKDLRAVPLWSRRARLRQLLGLHTNAVVRFSEDFDAPPSRMLEAARMMGLEGVMLKRRDAPYSSGRSDTWLKMKCSLRQEFVVCGFTDRAGSPREIGSLLLAYHENDRLRTAGSVGTGWDADTARNLRKRLDRLEAGEPVIDPRSLVPRRGAKRGPGELHWVKPEVVVEIAFSGWTSEGHLRHASFKGLRMDKPAGEVVREIPVSDGRHKSLSSAEASPRRAAKDAPYQVKVSHPDRVIDESSGLTKLDLVRYYQSIADWIMPHLADRPVSLLRAPDGILGEQFFQKHADPPIAGLTILDASLWPAHAALLAIPDARALAQAAQMNMVELHTWNARVPHLDRPDRMVFDLDPGEGVKWPQVQEAALLTRALLTELGLDSWLKTSGGKGLHVVVPLTPRRDSATVKDFSRAVVMHLAKTIPGRFAARSGPSNRVGKIFVDYLRNGHSQTTAAAYSARARPGMGVSMPIDWEQLEELRSSAQWTVATARDYLSLRKADPWAGYWKSRQGLTSAMKKLGYQPPKMTQKQASGGRPKKKTRATAAVAGRKTAKPAEPRK